MASYVRELFVTFAIGFRFVRLFEIILLSQVDTAYAYDDDSKVDFPTTQVNDTKLFIYRTQDTVPKKTTRLRRFASCRTDDDIMLKVCLHVFTGFCFPFSFSYFPFFCLDCLMAVEWGDTIHARRGNATSIIISKEFVKKRLNKFISFLISPRATSQI